MRLLFVHADHFEFETTTEAGAGVAETEGVPGSGRMEDCVVAFVSVERGDAADPDAVVENAAAEVRDVTDRLNTRKVVLSPSVHLSEDLADADDAEAVLRGLETALADDREVLRTPSGWHVAVEVAGKGHPFAERSRRVTPESGEADADDAGRDSEWRLAFPDGRTVTLPDRDPLSAVDPADADRVNDDLRALVTAEVEGATASAEDRESAHVELLRERGLADRVRPAGDSGSGDADALRWYPRGKLIRDSVAEYVDDLAVEYGGLPVETPATPVSVVEDADLAESDLPLRLYESSGRPELHAATADLARAKAELRAQVELAARAGEDLGLNYEPVVRLTRAFYDANEEWVESLVATLGRPALLEIRPERRRSVEVAFAVVGRSDTPIETAAVRLDERAGQFVEDSADGDSRRLPVVRCAPSGDVEGAVVALLETAAGREVPRLPTWLSPTQVRFVPVGDRHVEDAEALADDLESAGVRVDVDDREASVGERLARAETDWVPYYAVVGDRETDGDEDDEITLKVNVRDRRAEREMTVGELREAVRAEIRDFPSRSRYLPKRLGERPHLTGR